MMQTPPDDDQQALTPEDAEIQIEAIADEYLESLRGPNPVDRAAFVARNPEIADVLDARLKLIDMMIQRGKDRPSWSETASGEAVFASSSVKETEERRALDFSVHDRVGRYRILEELVVILGGVQNEL